MVGAGRDLKDHLVLTLCHELGHLPLEGVLDLFTKKKCHLQIFSMFTLGQQVLQHRMGFGVVLTGSKILPLVWWARVVLMLRAAPAQARS